MNTSAAPSGITRRVTKAVAQINKTEPRGTSMRQVSNPDTLITTPKLPTKSAKRPAAVMR